MGWHRHDSGAVHRDDEEDCTWLGNPVPCDEPEDVGPAQPDSPHTEERRKAIDWALDMMTKKWE